MDLEKWKVFLAIAEFGNLSAAASRMNISQSGASYTIKQLENEVGFTLFSRSKWKGMELTPSGQLVYEQINNLLQESERFTQTISKINGNLTGSLRIGTFESIAITLLPPILAAFQKDFPKIDIYIKEGDNDYLERALRSQKVDLCFSSYQHRSGFHWIDLALDPIMAILPSDHPLAQQDTVPIQVFNTEPFIVSMNIYDYDVNNVLRHSQIKPTNIVCSSQNDHTILALVKQKLGISLLFERIIATETNALGLATGAVVAKLTEPLFARKLGIALPSLRNATPATQTFIQYAKRMFPELLCASRTVNMDNLSPIIP